MKRSGVLTRRKPLARGTARLSRTTRITSVSEKRRAARLALRAFRAHVMARSKGWCEVCGWQATDAHHVIKRSQGGSHDPVRNGIALCRVCHDQTDRALAQGRLVIGNVAPDRFEFRIVRAPDKFVLREGVA